ncbi:hypothetical protein [uncultured Methylibium sp.]|uniref:hypothetical protein n=1 Tax=uncultured Methylibium sp. TaxID=381093 RepID=UPI0025E5959A|nr:hypothetical protein [uncultured Methylibium sp.]
MTGQDFSNGAAIGRGVQRIVSFVLRALMAAVGLVFMLMLMAFGLVVGSLVVMWALLRGRRPAPVRFGMPRGAAWQDFRRAASGTPRGEVIDIEAREVSPGGADAPRDRP